MIEYAEYSDYYIFLEYLSKAFNFSLIDYLVKNKKNFWSIKLTYWQEISNYTEFSGVDIFQSEVKKQNLVIDTSDLKINKNSIEFLQKQKQILQDKDINIILINYQDNLNAEDKKLLKKILAINSFKTSDESLRINLAKEYAHRINLQLDTKKIEKLAKESTNTKEIIDKLDFIDLSGDLEKSLIEVSQESNLPIFMQSFNLNNLDRDIPKWIDIAETEVQLVMSLIYTKLSKQQHKKIKKIKKEVIETDQNIKLNNKLKPKTWLKLMFWRIKETMH